MSNSIEFLKLCEQITYYYLTLFSQKWLDPMVELFVPAQKIENKETVNEHKIDSKITNEYKTLYKVEIISKCSRVANCIKLHTKRK